MGHFPLKFSIFRDFVVRSLMLVCRKKNKIMRRKITAREPRLHEPVKHREKPIVIAHASITIITIIKCSWQGERGTERGRGRPKLWSQSAGATSVFLLRHLAHLRPVESSIFEKFLSCFETSLMILISAKKTLLSATLAQPFLLLLLLLHLDLLLL